MAILAGKVTEPVLPPKRVFPSVIFLYEDIVTSLVSALNLAVYLTYSQVMWLRLHEFYKSLMGELRMRPLRAGETEEDKQLIIGFNKVSEELYRELRKKEYEEIKELAGLIPDLQFQQKVYEFETKEEITNYTKNQISEFILKLVERYRRMEGLEKQADELDDAKTLAIDLSTRGIDIAGDKADEDFDLLTLDVLQKITEAEKTAVDPERMKDMRPMLATPFCILGAILDVGTLGSSLGLKVGFGVAAREASSILATNIAGRAAIMFSNITKLPKFTLSQIREALRSAETLTPELLKSRRFVHEFFTHIKPDAIQKIKAGLDAEIAKYLLRAYTGFSENIKHTLGTAAARWEELIKSLREIGATEDEIRGITHGILGEWITRIEFRLADWASELEKGNIVKATSEIDKAVKLNAEFSIRFFETIEKVSKRTKKYIPWEELEEWKRLFERMGHQLNLLSPSLNLTTAKAFAVDTIHTFIAPILDEYKILIEKAPPKARVLIRDMTTRQREFLTKAIELESEIMKADDPFKIVLKMRDYYTEWANVRDELLKVNADLAKELAEEFPGISKRLLRLNETIKIADGAFVEFLTLPQVKDYILTSSIIEIDEGLLILHDNALALAVRVPKVEKPLRKAAGILISVKEEMTHKTLIERFAILNARKQEIAEAIKLLEESIKLVPPYERMIAKITQAIKENTEALISVYDDILGIVREAVLPEQVLRNLMTASDRLLTISIRFSAHADAVVALKDELIKLTLTETDVARLDKALRALSEYFEAQFLRVRAITKAEDAVGVFDEIEREATRLLAPVDELAEKIPGDMLQLKGTSSLIKETLKGFRAVFHKGAIEAGTKILDTIKPKALSAVDELIRTLEGQQTRFYEFVATNTIYDPEQVVKMFSGIISDIKEYRRGIEEATDAVTVYALFNKAWYRSQLIHKRLTEFPPLYIRHAIGMKPAVDDVRVIRELEKQVVDFDKSFILVLDKYDETGKAIEKDLIDTGLGHIINPRARSKAFFHLVEQTLRLRNIHPLTGGFVAIDFFLLPFQGLRWMAKRLWSILMAIDRIIPMKILLCILVVTQLDVFLWGIRALAEGLGMDVWWFTGITEKRLKEWSGIITGTSIALDSAIRDGAVKEAEELLSILEEQVRSYRKEFEAKADVLKKRRVYRLISLDISANEAKIDAYRSRIDMLKGKTPTITAKKGTKIESIVNKIGTRK